MNTLYYLIYQYVVREMLFGLGCINLKKTGRHLDDSVLVLAGDQGLRGGWRGGHGQARTVFGHSRSANMYRGLINSGPQHNEVNGTKFYNSV